MEIKKHGLINKFAKPTDNNEAKATTPAAQTTTTPPVKAGYTPFDSSAQKEADESPSTKTGVNTLENALAKKGGTSVEALMSQAKECEEKDGEKAIKPAAKATTPAAKATTVQTKEEAGFAKAGYELFDSSAQKEADESLSKEEVINNLADALAQGGKSVATLMPKATEGEPIVREEKGISIPVQKPQKPHPADNKEPRAGEHRVIKMTVVDHIGDITIPPSATHEKGQQH